MPSGMLFAENDGGSENSAQPFIFSSARNCYQRRMKKLALQILLFSLLAFAPSASAADCSQAAADAAKKALDQANQNLAAATAEAKAAAEKTAADAKTAFDAAQKAATDAEAKRVLADKEKTAAIARAKALDTKAKEKDVKFAAYSLPIVVEVKPAPEPAKK